MLNPSLPLHTKYVNRCEGMVTPFTYKVCKIGVKLWSLKLSMLLRLNSYLWFMPKRTHYLQWSSWMHIWHWLSL